jgi:hypothetical protein
MTATALDSAIFRDIFTTPAMREVFSDERRTGYYLEIEIALARAQSRLGIIPEKAAREIERQCRIENIDLARLKQQTERIGYPILGVVQQIVGLCAVSAMVEVGGPPRRISPTPGNDADRAALGCREGRWRRCGARRPRGYRDARWRTHGSSTGVCLTFG